MKYLLSCIIFFSLFHIEAKEASIKVLQDQIRKRIKKSKVKIKDLGLYIVANQNGNSEVVYALNADKKFIPASLTKIPTALAAFNYLGGQHKFTTTLESEGVVKDGSLKGNLYLVGGGDPTFTSESMWSLVNEFARENIHTIERDIIVDDTYFDSIRYDKFRDPVRKDRAYDAPVGAMSFNWNSVNIFIKPTKVGKPAQIIADPIGSYFNVINKTKTVRGRKQKLRVSRIASEVAGEFPFETIVVSGTIGVRAKEYVSYKSITKPDLWSGHSLKKFLAEKGIKVLGKVKTGKKPARTAIRSSFDSAKLYNSIKSMNKYSNNFVAEMLIKNIAAKYKRPASMDYGLKKVNSFLLKNGFEKNNYNYQNASGLTRDNLFRPLDFTNLLLKSKKDNLIFPEFLTTLPISAVDGTLKSRMTKLESAQKVRAKTGMLNGVVGLAGYTYNDDIIYTFTFIFNGKPVKLKNARDLFDYISAELSK